MKKHLLTLLIGLCAAFSAHSQWFREPKLTQEQRFEIASRALDGDTTDLYRLRMVKYPAELPDDIDTSDLQASSSHPRMRLYRPSHNTERLPLLIWAHAGGWMTGCLEDCEPYLCRLAREGRMAILSIDYSLAPEHQFPQGLNDLIAATDYAYSHSDELRIDTNAISIGGEGAGANLALSACFRIHHSPRSLCLIAPVTKAWNDQSVSWERYQRRFDLDGAFMELYSRAYVGDAILLQDPLVSPDNAADYQLQRLTKTLMFSPEYDILEDMGAEFAERMQSLGCDIQRTLLNGVAHSYMHDNKNYYEIGITIRGIVDACSR